MPTVASDASLRFSQPLIEGLGVEAAGPMEAWSKTSRAHGSGRGPGGCCDRIASHLAFRGGMGTAEKTPGGSGPAEADRK